MLIDWMRWKLKVADLQPWSDACLALVVEVRGQRESLIQSMWTMSFADRRDKVYCKPVVGTRWKFVISLKSQLVEELYCKREVQV